MQQNETYYCPDDETSDSIEEFETNLLQTGKNINWYQYQKMFRIDYRFGDKRRGLEKG